MNINEYKKYLQDIHGTLDDDPENKQMQDRLGISEIRNRTVKKGKPLLVNLGPGEPVGPQTTTAKDRKQDRKDAERREHETKVAQERQKQRGWSDSVEHDGDELNEGPVDKMIEYKPNPKVDKSTDAPTTAAGDSLRPNSKTGEKIQKLKEIPECVQQYFENYFGDSLNEDTSDDDIVDAVNALIYLCELVCDAVELESIQEKLKPHWTRTSSPGKPNIIHPAQSVVGGKTPYIGRGLDSKTFATDIPKKYADSTTPIRTIRPSTKGSLKLTQSGKKPVKRKPIDWEGRYDPTDGSF